MNLHTRQIIFALAVLLCPGQRLAAYDNFLPGSRFLALSQCGTAIPDIWSVSQNQAGLAYLTKPAFSISSERRFMMKELSVHSLAAVYPLQRITFGTALNYFGYSKFHEMKAGLALSMPLNKKLSAGLMLDYFSSFIEGSSKRLNRITAELGLMGNPTQNVTIGLHIFNPFPEKTSKGQDVILPTNLRLGLAYKIRSIVILSTETQLGTKQKPDYRFGLEYLPVENLAIRMGLATWPAKLSFGVGYSWKHFNTGIALSQHPILGTTTTIELTYNF